MSLMTMISRPNFVHPVAAKPSGFDFRVIAAAGAPI
jgi:hypothetical protein